MNPSIEHIDKVLDKASTKHDFHVYTGVKKSPHKYWEETKHHKDKPIQVHLPAFTSTSTSFRKAKSFSEVDDNPKNIIVTGKQIGRAHV